jgi:hypothetical protein
MLFSHDNKDENLKDVKKRGYPEQAASSSSLIKLS